MYEAIDEAIDYAASKIKRGERLLSASATPPSLYVVILAQPPML